MRRKIAIAAVLGLAGLIIWTFLNLHLNTKQLIRTTQRLLENGSSLEKPEETIV